MKRVGTTIDGDADARATLHAAAQSPPGFGAHPCVGPLGARVGQPNDPADSRIPVGFRTRMRSGDPRGAFTLVELLIATLCFAIILAALNSTFYATMRLRSRTQSLVENDLQLNMAATTIRRDLQGIVIPSSTGTGTLSGPLTTQPQSVMNTMGSGPNGILEFNTTSGVLGNDPVYWGEVQQVSYYLKPSELRNARGMDLVRGVCRNLLPVVTNTLADLKETRLLSGVDSLTFSFYDGTNWQTMWDSTSQQDLSATLVPQLIKLSIGFVQGQDDKRSLPPLAIEVPIMLQARTNQASAASSTTGASMTGGGTTGGGNTGRGTTGGGNTGGGNSGRGTTGGGNTGGGGRGGGGATGGGKG